MPNIGIIGGGVATAVALHRAGMMLWPNATRVLKDPGLLEKVAASSGPNQHFLVRVSAGTILMNIGLGKFEVPALCARRSDLLGALLNTGGDRFTWYATANTDSDHADSSEVRQRELLRLFVGWHEPVERLVEATDESGILKNGACDLTPLRRWGHGRVMLLGDAAHPCTPNLGLGGCMALEDALVLAKSFCEEASPERALRRYESLRRARTRHVQQRSLLMGHIGQWENRVMAGGRKVVTSMLPAKLFERNLRRVYSYAA